MNKKFQNLCRACERQSLQKLAATKQTTFSYMLLVAFALSGDAYLMVRDVWKRFVTDTKDMRRKEKRGEVR